MGVFCQPVNNTATILYRKNILAFGQAGLVVTEDSAHSITVSDLLTCTKQPGNSAACAVGDTSESM